MHPALTVAVAALVLAGAGYAAAQTTESLDIQAILGRSEPHAQDAEALAREVTRRSAEMQDEARAVTAQGRDNLQRSAAQPGGGVSGPIDFDELVGIAGAYQAEGGRAPQLIVFASLSMPPQSLKQLLADTAAAGGSVVFNGFPDNSMRAFQQGLLKLTGPNQDTGSIGIDPRLFRAFGVEAVPAFVVVTSDFDLCDGFDCRTAVPPFDRMSGNVSLRHVLETFAQGGGPGAAIAAQTLQRLKQGPA